VQTGDPLDYIRPERGIGQHLLVPRRLNLLTLAATAFSWFVLGLRYGFGYCPCTDWHWQVKLKLGEYDIPNSYVKYLIDTLTGLNVNASLVDALTGIGFALAVVASVSINLRDWRRQRSRSQEKI
jgi:hypothetical protein